jgi:hypothetical protein
MSGPRARGYLPEYRANANGIEVASMVSATWPANLPSLGTTLPVPEAIEQQRTTQKTNMVGFTFYHFSSFTRTVNRS